MNTQSTQSSGSELDEQLSAYFDGELGDGNLDGAELELGATLRALVDGELGGDLESDAELAAKLADLAFMRTMIVGALEHQADRVPEARFEQVWDGFELALERESRLQEAAEVPPSLWERLSAWIRPVRLPLAVVGAAGALVWVFARSAGAPSETEGDEGTLAAVTEPANTQDEAASQARPNESARTTPAPTQPSPRVAVATPITISHPNSASSPSPEIDPDVMMFPQPEPGEAEIRRIEFGGRTGTISQVEGSRGTTTVIWVTEDDGPVDSERSL